MAQTQLPAKFWSLYIGLALVNLLAAMDISIVATALPTVVGEFNQTENISWIVVGYSLAVAAMVPVYGKLADKYGSARLFKWVIGVFLAASMMCGLSTDIYMLTVSRVLQGLGGGGLGVLPLTILSSILPERSRTKYIAPMASVWAVAAIGGPVIGGLLTDTVGWRWIFFINLPLGAIALLLVSGAIAKAEQLHHEKLFDLSTWVLFVSASAVTVLTMHSVTSNLTGSLSAETTVLVAASVVLIALFIWRSIVSSNPVIPVRMLANRGAASVLIISTLSSTNLFSITSFVPTVLQMGFGMPATLAGLGLVPMVLGIVVSSILTGRRVSKTGKWHHLPRISTAIAAASMLIIYLFVHQLGPWLIVVCLGAAAAGIGLFGQLALTLVQAFSKAKVFGAVTATVNVSRDLTGSIIATVAGGIFGFGVVRALSGIALPQGVKPTAIRPSDFALMDPSTVDAVRQAYIDAFQPVFLNSAIAYLLVMVLAYTLPKLELKQSH